MRICHFTFLFVILTLIFSVMNTSYALSRQWSVIESHHIGKQPIHQYVKSSRAEPTEQVELIFVTKQNSIEELLLDISNPKSSNYGKHLRKEEVDQLTIIPEYVDGIVKYLNDNGIQITSNQSGYIKAVGSVEQFESLLNTKFHVYINSENGQSVIRTDEYSLPADLASYVTTILNTVQFPVQLHSGPKHHLISRSQTDPSQV